jgi:hypothetical protein
MSATRATRAVSTSASAVVVCSRWRYIAMREIVRIGE